MPIRTRNHLAQLNAMLTPVVSLVAITKVVRRARAIKHHELPKLLFSFQHMTQCRTQWCDACSHRDKDEITTFDRIEFEPMSRDPNQFNLIADAHVVNHRARADF